MFQLVSMLAAFALGLSWLVTSHFPPWMNWHSEAVAFFAVFLLGCGGLAQMLRSAGPGTVALPFVALPFIGLALVAVFQRATGLLPFWGDVWVVWFYIALCITTLMLGFAAASSPAPPLFAVADASAPLTRLAIVLLVGALVSSVIAFAQVFSLWEQSGWIVRMPNLRRPGGNLGQPNQLATLLLMGLASLLFLYESKKLAALPSSLIALTLLVCVAATESRTSVLSLGILMFWWFVKRKSLGFRLSPWVVSYAGIGFLGLFWSWPWLMDAVIQTSGVRAEVNTSVGARWLVWPQLIKAVWQQPWFGWGIGQVSTAHNAVADAYVSSEPFTYAHNIALDFALGIGIPLTALFSVMSMVWLWRRLKSARSLVPWYCLAVVLPVMVHSMLEFPFAYAYFLLPVMFALGALEGFVGIKPAIRLGVKPVAVMLLVITVIMVWSVLEYVSIEEDFRIVRFESLKLGSTPSDYERPKVVLLTQLDALLKGGRIVPKPGMSADEVELARTVALRYPWPATQSRYALSLALNGNPNEAIRQLRVMRALHGEKTYAQVRDGWVITAAEKYPQLRNLHLP